MTARADLTPEHMAAWQQGKLDSLCLDCGASSVASDWCYAPLYPPRHPLRNRACGSRNLDYRTHAEQTGAAFLCGGPNRNGRRPGQIAPLRPVSSAQSPETAPVTVSTPLQPLSSQAAI